MSNVLWLYHSERSEESLQQRGDSSLTLRMTVETSKLKKKTGEK